MCKALFDHQPDAIGAQRQGAMLGERRRNRIDERMASVHRLAHISSRFFRLHLQQNGVAQTICNGFFCLRKKQNFTKKPLSHMFV
jgi:NADPH-dependent ferric siderophore reductase